MSKLLNHLADENFLSLFGQLKDGIKIELS